MFLKMLNLLLLFNNSSLLSVDQQRATMIKFNAPLQKVCVCSSNLAQTLWMLMMNSLESLKQASMTNENRKS